MSILAVTGLPTQGVCRVGRMVKRRFFFFGLLVDWAVASWPSLFFFLLGSLTNGEGFGDKMIWSQANVSLG